MYKKRLIFFSMLFFPLMFSCSQEYFQYQEVLRVGDRSYFIFLNWVDENKKIANEFYVVEQNDMKKKILVLKNDIILDRDGNTIIDLSKHNPILYGVSIEFSYPTNKRYRPGLILKPYFGTSDSVGDSFVIQVSEDYLNFEKRTYNIP